MDEISPQYLHVLAWDRLGRKGEVCRILTPNTKISNSIQIEFKKDGYRAIVPRQAVRRATPEKTNLLVGQNGDSGSVATKRRPQGD